MSRQTDPAYPVPGTGYGLTIREKAVLDLMCASVAADLICDETPFAHVERANQLADAYFVWMENGE